eukprot:11218151-Lingulodinium_polyedra.AAC.1
MGRACGAAPPARPIGKRRARRTCLQNALPRPGSLAYRPPPTRHPESHDVGEILDRVHRLAGHLNTDVVD